MTGGQVESDNMERPVGAEQWSFPDAMVCGVRGPGVGALAPHGHGMVSHLPMAVSKSITPSTDFHLVYLECMELACQTSALAIKHAMVTIALPCVRQRHQDW